MAKLIDDPRAEALFQRVQDSISRESDPKSTIINLRQIHETIFKYLCENAKTSLSGLFPRLQYARETSILDNVQYTQSNILRLLCNKAVHEENAVISAQELASAYYVIVNLLQHISDIAPASELIGFLKSRNAAPFPPLASTPKVDFNCLVLGFNVDYQQKNLTLSVVNDDGENCSILLRNDIPDYPGRQWTDLGKTLWKYAALNCQNLSPVSGRSLHYNSGPQTIIVLEPDFLIDISSLAECFGSKSFHPEFFLLNRFIHEPSNDKALSGKAVNSILDELILDPQSSYKDIFARFLTENPFSMIAGGYATALKMYKDIEHAQLPNLLDFANSIQDSEVLLEASFIAPEFGLQGRLDVLQKQKGKYSIVELKSGKPPANGLWKQNHMQVIGYNLMINSCFGRTNCKNSSIFYSRDLKNPLRNVVSIARLEQELMLCRNRLLGIMHSITTDPAVFLDWVRQSPIKYDNPILNNKIERIKNILNRLEDHEYDWLLAMMKSIVIEIWHVKTGSTGTRNAAIYGFNALWKQSEEMKLENYELLTNLRIRKVANNTIHFDIEGEETITNFRSGDIIVLYQRNLAVDRQELIRGKILQIDDNSLTIQVRGGLKNSKRLSRETCWSVEHDMYESSLYAPLSSVFTFLSEGSKERRSIILGISPPQFEDTDRQEGKDYIDDIIARIEAAKDYFIIQGPPGTGKTSGLLSKYIKLQQLKPDKTILVLSFTNRAIDEICLNLEKQQVSYIRTGSSSVIQDSLLGNMIHGKRFQEIHELITSNRVWVSTVQSCNAWYQDLLKLIDIDELIIDEASQIIEASILGVISKIPKVILIGDQNQLPPIVIQPDRRITFSDPKLLELQYSTYSQSLLERLFSCSRDKAWDSARFMLYKHYRMHESIAGLVTRYYDDRLLAVRAAQFEKLPLPQGDSCSSELLNHRLVWVETEPSKQVHYDLVQVELIHKIVSMLLENKDIQDIEKDIGIIAPFRAMIMAISKNLPPAWQGISIDTVERYQGSERKIMLICLPLQNHEDLRSIESLSMDGSIDRKLNVALSRAQERVIILGNSGICSSSVHYLNLIDRIRHNGIFITQKEI